MRENGDWPLEAWLKIAVVQLGISPSEFWKMSLFDWFALARSKSGAPITQEDLNKMEDDYDTRK